ncbi:Fumarate reductase subunit C [Candidatus Providencia siddallii]|uniref:Fumarate reductase subunit C n=1 Tax=Candidatus Providencia siddallii TaxID=1715285 RepID=A0A0M6W7W8_9GAMM|nr:Fumarate reductase subunit C [Candidatus Providencia siddallii]
MTIKRKPYIREIKSDWWRKNNFYKLYMMRECTSIFQIWFSFLVLYGIFMLKNGEKSWFIFINFLNNPIVYIINTITLIAMLIHTITWFNLVPKAINIIINDIKISEKTITKFFWGITMLLAAIILIVLL